MTINHSLPNFLNAPLVDMVPKYGDMFSKILEGYKMGKAPQEIEQKLESGRLENEGTAFSNALKKKYSEREIEANIGHKEALADAYKRGVKRIKGTPGSLEEYSASSPKERRAIFNSMGPDGKAELYRIGKILGHNPQQVTEKFIQGHDFAKEAEEKGIDLSQETGSYLATGANRTAQKNQEAAFAELDTLEKETANQLSAYGGNKIMGYSPKATMDMLRGKNQKEIIDFLVSRAVQPEIAAVRTRIAAGSNAAEALKDAKKAALADFKIFESFVTPEIHLGVQQGINSVLGKGFEARSKSMYGHKPKDEEKSAEGLDKYLKDDFIGLGI